MSTTLEKELETFRRELPRLLADPANHGKYVLIRGVVVAGTYPDRNAAYAAGCATFGPVSFLVKEVTEREEVFYFSRNLTRCQ